jgi:RNA polymerase sigma factor (sigma-70 family)
VHDATSTSSSGDVSWEQIYRENEVRLRALIARRVPSDVVDDVLQDTFLRAYRSRDTLDRDRPVGPWLTTIALRAASDHRRDRMRHVLPDVPASASDAYEELRITARLRVIESAFRSLRPRQRRLLASVAIDDVSQVNIAREEGATSEAVRAAVLRARRRFRAEYERLARDSGLASLSGIKPAIGRLRARLHRVGTMVPIHADACLGLATLTAVTFLTLGASNGTAVAAVTPRIVVSGLSPVASLEQSGLEHSPEIAVDTNAGSLTVRLTTEAAQVEVPDSSTIRYAPLDAEASIGRDGLGATVTVQVGDDKRNTYGDVTVNGCESDTLSRVLCTGIQAGEAVAQKAGAS